MIPSWKSAFGQSVRKTNQVAFTKPQLVRPRNMTKLHLITKQWGCKTTGGARIKGCTRFGPYKTLAVLCREVSLEIRPC